MPAFYYQSIHYLPNYQAPKRWETWSKTVFSEKELSKKISKFKGIQKQKKVPVDVARNSATEIKFVTNKFHLPLLRHELENLLSNAQKLFSNESMDLKGEIPEGYQHVFMNSFLVFVVNHLELREISTSQFDLGSSLYAICDDCGLSEFLATGDHHSSDDAP
ncbi:unnamed protein product [Pocillopora meandrina]|uniref:Uncharacterized protein n=1 Tax=Pocillopora meandrina TaxID=46732 RepID=A0AAU9W897_9CNID|nr:unnamed protein product [Pocillopora meandrina]